MRQALAHAINREENGIVSMGESGIPSVTMSGMSDNLAAAWMSDKDIAALNPYACDVEQAAALLADAGRTKDGDAWRKPDGSEAAYELLWPAEFPDWSAAGQNAAEQLTLFGSRITPMAVTAAQQPIDVDKGEFDIAVRGWGSSSNPHPHFSYTQAFLTHPRWRSTTAGSGRSSRCGRKRRSPGRWTWSS